MLNDTTRALHARSGLAFPSDMTDAEWAVLEPLLPPASHVGRPAPSTRAASAEPEALPSAGRLRSYAH